MKGFFLKIGQICGRISYMKNNWKWQWNLQCDLNQNKNKLYTLKEIFEKKALLLETNVEEKQQKEKLLALEKEKLLK